MFKQFLCDLCKVLILKKKKHGSVAEEAVLKKLYPNDI